MHMQILCIPVKYMQDVYIKSIHVYMYVAIMYCQ